MLFQSVRGDITPLAQEHCEAGKLEVAIGDIRDDPISALRDLQQELDGNFLGGDYGSSSIETTEGVDC
jgi:hypothetical protein